MTTTIQDYLAQFRGQEVVYLPNPGNAGDSVIAAGTYHCLDAAGIRYVTPYRRQFDPAGRIVLYGGGGNLIGMDTYAARSLRDIHARARHLTILPHTVKDVDPLLDAFGDNVTVICRERVSYDHVRGRGGRYRTLLMHDMAFDLDLERLFSGRDRFDRIAMLADFAMKHLRRDRQHTNFGNVRRYLFPGPVAAALQARPDGGRLNAFRRDGEASGIAIPEDNVDLSTVFEYGVGPAPVAFHAARGMIGVLMRCGEVHTNRLHVAISSAIAGRDTKFYSNSYYKCRAVYEHSMRDRYPNVAWMG